MWLSRYEGGKMGICEVEADLGRDKEAEAHNLLKPDLNQGIDRPGSHTNALEHNESSLLIQKLIYLPGTQ